MIDGNVKLRLLIAAVCCFVLVLLPMSSSAQGIVKGTKHGIQKGAGAVEKGAEGAAEKTKEGAQAVGHGAKKAVTGDKNNSSDSRMKSSEPQRDTSSTENKPGETGQKRLPKTAGELPLLALAGFLALAGAVSSKLARRLRQ